MAKGFKKGHLVSSETRKKISEIQKGKPKPWLRGKKQTEEHKRKVVETRKKNGSYGHSEETKKKISEAKKGKMSWRKGKKLSQKHRENLSKAHKGKKLTPEHIENLRKSHKEVSKKTREKIKKSLKGKRPKNFGINFGFSGEKNWNWKGGITKLTEQIRKCFKYRQWRSDVFTRDSFICQKCNNKGGKLNAHHIKKFSIILDEYKIKTLEQALNCEELWNINNGITYCKKCHRLKGRHIIKHF